MTDVIASVNVPDHVDAKSVFEFDIYNDKSLTDDLHNSYATLHDKAPGVFYTPCNGGHWVITRFKEIFEVVKDYEHFSVREMQIPRVENPPVFIPLSLDPPHSIPYRQALMPFFTVRAIGEMEEKIRNFAADILDQIASKGECDFVYDVSSQFPVSVFMELMGMPLERLRDFREIADAYFNARSNEEIGELSGRIIGIMTEMVELRRADPKDDLISKMVQFEIEGRPITLEELQSALFLMFLGGMDTVTNVASYSFRHLAQDPDLQERLISEPALITKFVEESIRSFGVINTPRIVTKDFERFGVQFREGEMVLCILPLGSRDPDRFKNPNEFDLDRKAAAHLTFSSGPHLCLGHNLARLEIQILVEEWIKRIGKFRAKPNERHKSRFGTVMALEKLPLEWEV